VVSTADDAARLAPYLQRVTAAAGDVLALEGAPDRDLYFLDEGAAAVMRGDLRVSTLRAGSHFGELALVAGSPRRATVVADTDVVLSKLSRAAFEALEQADPALAVRVLESAFVTVGRWLDDMTGTVDALLRSRGLPRNTHVEVTIGGTPHRVAVGTPLARVLPEAVDGEAVVAALVDRRATSLVAPLLSGGTIEPLTAGHWEGRRVYRHSLGLLLLEAAAGLAPDLTFELGHSLGYASAVRVTGEVESWSALADKLNTRMLELVDADLPLQERWWTVDEAREHFARAGWTSAVALLRTSRQPSGRVVSFGRVHAPRMAPITPRTGMLSGFCVLAAPDGLLLVYGEIDDIPSTPGRTIIAPTNKRRRAAATIAAHGEKLIRPQQRWLEAMGVTNVGELNGACIQGNVGQLIAVAEGHHEKRVSRIADAIAAKREQIKVVCIAGPSSSGKSTFIRRLNVQLQVVGLRPLGLSLDDYYRDRESMTPGPDGQIDFEALGALRTDLLQDHLRRLVGGEAVRTARFDFRTGRSDAEGGRELRVGAGTLLMLEGIHGLNPQLLETIPSYQVFRVFVCPLAQLPFDRLFRLHASDLRLIRRIVRDRHGRDTDAATTIERWPSVRDGERRHIFTFQHHADEVFDTSLIYELSVLKVYAERYLLEVSPQHPSYTTAFRLLGLLDHFVTIYPDHVPPTSILREFIGGSGFEY
jgi:uridine kinase